MIVMLGLEMGSNPRAKGVSGHDVFLPCISSWILEDPES